MIENLEIQSANFTENEARLRFAARPDSGIESLAGRLSGPYCETSKTLATKVPLISRSVPHERIPNAEAVLVDPCYWTPRLPFLYIADLSIAYSNEKKSETKFAFGLKRWFPEKASLYLERRRIVLRGGRRLATLTREDLREAHELETAIITDCPNDDLCTDASSIGVALVADLRSTPRDVAGELAILDWLPAVMVALVSTEQLEAAMASGRLPKQCLLAQCVDSRSQPRDALSPGANLLAIELEEKERPPHWMSLTTLPTIAIRLKAPSKDLCEIRRGCDRLQAELAPEFNLAGYFV